VIAAFVQIVEMIIERVSDRSTPRWASSCR
jgi:Na+-transporting NADH:ubiquinone oxidoreductase subunit NqrE